MKVEFTTRAARDLREMSAYSRSYFGERVAAELEARMRETITRIADAPESAPPVERRPGMRVLPLGRYPYRVFYRVLEDRVRILHIRHTGRRPWVG